MQQKLDYSQENYRSPYLKRQYTSAEEALFSNNAPASLKRKKSNNGGALDANEIYGNDEGADPEQRKINHLIMMLENRDSELADSDNFESMDFDLRVPNKEQQDDAGGGSDDDEELLAVADPFKGMQGDEIRGYREETCNQFEFPALAPNSSMSADMPVVRHHKKSGSGGGTETWEDSAARDVGGKHPSGGNCSIF